MRTLARLIFGLTFILSGFFKFVDPVGTSLIVKEYLEIFHLAFMTPVSVWIGIAMASAEFVLGASVILGLRMRIVSTISLIFISFFTLLTLYLALFNPIKDCGCFGEAIHLSNWQTFEKNIVLLACCLGFFFQRKKVEPIAPAIVEWALIAVFATIALSISIHSYNALPYHDFTAYKIGTDLNNLSSGAAQYETTFIYSKDGQTERFKIDNLPDESWTFVDSETELISGSTEMAQIDLALSDTDGNYWTEELFSKENLAAIIIWNPESISNEQMEDMERFGQKAKANGVESVIFNVEGESELDMESYLADRKALMTLNRSNGGVVFFHKGIITEKWPSQKISSINFDNIDDYEFNLLKKEVASRMRLSFTIVGILIFILLIRYSCRMSYKRKSER